MRVGHALKDLPLIAAAFNEGRLSFDKVRAITRIASGDDEVFWVQLGLHTSGAQLTRICREMRSSLDIDDPRRADDELAHRGVRC